MIDREKERTIELLRSADFTLPGQMERVQNRLGDDADRTAAQCSPSSRMPRRGQQVRRGKRARRLALAVAITAGAVAMAFAIPPVRSFAEELLVRFRDFFFDTTEETEVEIAGPQFVDSERWIVDTLEELSIRAPFDVGVLEDPPRGLAFHQALIYHTSRTGVTQVYRSEYRIVHVFQQPLSDAREHAPLGYPVGMGVSDDAPLTDVEIGPFAGQQVHGTWVGSKDEYRWRSDFPVNRIRFSDGAFLYGVEVRPFIPRSDIDEVDMPSQSELALLALEVARTLVEGEG